MYTTEYMREIEIKARLHNSDRLEQSLKQAGIKLSEPIKQHDVVFGQPGAKDNALGANWLRIRTENDKKVYFTLKKSVVGHLDSIEHETAVEDAVELQEIILQLGYEPYSDLTKVRRKAKHGQLEICVDEIPKLGTFIEVEKMMGQDAVHDTVIEELWRFLTSLGVSKVDEVHEGYDVMERKQRQKL